MLKRLCKGTGILLLILIALVILSVFVFIIICAVTGKGEIKPFLNDKGEVLKNSVSEKIFVDISGKKNGMIIRGKNVENPVILYISGGPGVPQYWLNEFDNKDCKNKIEDYFTVCWWDYYGEGLSYESGIDPSELTTERYEKDAVRVAEYLKSRFGKEKVYLMGHSAGSSLAFRIAQNYPDNFYCYFAMSQIVDEGDLRYQSGYDFMKEVFEKEGNYRALQYMNCLVTYENNEFKVLDRNALHDKWEKVLLMAGCGTTRELRSDAIGLFFPQMFSTCYTLEEKINYWRGKSILRKSPFDDEEIRLNESHVKIPVYFISGYYDYTTPVNLTKQFYENLDAPDKEMYVFNDSAHIPLWEENDKVLEVLKKYAQ